MSVTVGTPQLQVSVGLERRHCVQLQSDYLLRQLAHKKSTLGSAALSRFCDFENRAA